MLRLTKLIRPTPLYTTLSHKTLNTFRAMSVFNTSRLEGKTVLITGASAGIGASTAKLFAKAGVANLILTARRADKLAEVKKECEGAGKVNVITVEADMTKREDINQILPKAGNIKVDILVNNAGMVYGREAIGDIADSDIDVMFSTNVIGLIHLTQILVREFKKQNSGMVINLGSIAGREPYAGGAIYCATKHAVMSFSHTLLRELVSTPIRVVEIQPGMVETEFSLVRFRGDKEAADAVYKGMEPLTGEDIAEEIVWCASRPPHVNIAQMLVLPVAQATATISHKKQ
ncbi:NAD(P)-binding protein [Kockovaella imperatae]|uniref:NAD(P)-binding protein n=1 Tax=Kockovaella imperatae TaxID=4999 RepID=A0A1Y1UQC9_9TREE|nr:NAD(P)-binding protein [Kockovaella imperatae]ORX39704.1 NAD(P)-binding protein [Kockovaella imperatae]